MYVTVFETWSVRILSRYTVYISFIRYLFFNSNIYQLPIKRYFTRMFQFRIDGFLTKRTRLMTASRIVRRPITRIGVEEGESRCFIKKKKKKETERSHTFTRRESVYTNDRVASREITDNTWYQMPWVARSMNLYTSADSSVLSRPHFFTIEPNIR